MMRKEKKNIYGGILYDHVNGQVNFYTANNRDSFRVDSKREGVIKSRWMEIPSTASEMSKLIRGLK